MRFEHCDTRPAWVYDRVWLCETPGVLSPFCLTITKPRLYLAHLPVSKAYGHSRSFPRNVISVTSSSRLISGLCSVTRNPFEYSSLRFQAHLLSKESNGMNSIEFFMDREFGLVTGCIIWTYTLNPAGWLLSSHFTGLSDKILGKLMCFEFPWLKRELTMFLALVLIVYGISRFN